MRKRLLIGAICASLILGLSACGNANGDKQLAGAPDKTLGLDANNPLPDIEYSEGETKEPAVTQGAAEDDPQMGMDNQQNQTVCNVLRWEVPAAWEGHYSSENFREDDGTWWTEFREEPDYSDCSQGWLCSILQVKDNDTSRYIDVPSYDYLGQVNCADGSVYGIVVVYPTDVQPTEENMKLYGELYSHLDELIATVSADGNAEFSRGQGGVNEYILPTSDSIRLEDYDLADLNKGELRLARNEIFARHGRRFKDAALQAHFDSCSWYKGTIDADKFDDSVLNAVEIYNISMIKKAEKAR